MGIFQATMVCDANGHGCYDNGTTSATHYGYSDRVYSGYIGSATLKNWSSWFRFPITSYISATGYVFSSRLVAYPHSGTYGWVKFGPGPTDAWDESGDTHDNRVSGWAAIGDAYVSNGGNFDQYVDNDTRYRVANQWNGNFILSKTDSSSWQAWIPRQGSSASGTYYPRLIVRFGHRVPWATVGGVTRQLNSSWGGVPGGGGAVFRVRVYRWNGSAWVLVTQGDYSETTYSASWGNLQSGTYRVGATTVYDDGEVPDTGPIGAGWAWSANTTVDTGQTGPPTSALGDTPYRKKVRVSVPGQYVGSADYQVAINNSAGSTIATATVANGGTVDIDLVAQPDGVYTTYTRAHWSDGDYSTWSAQGPNVTISTPTVANAAATTTQLRQLTVTWNRITDAATYNVNYDNGGQLLTAISNTPGATGSGTNYTYSVNNSTVTLVLANRHSGNHTAKITPIYTNGYTGPVNPATATGTVVLPTPSAATTAVGDSPQKRQIQITAGHGTPGSWFNAQSWDIRRDNNDAAIVNITTSGGTIPAVPQGTHSIQIRARWSDGDVSSWLNSGSATTTSPGPTATASRQRSAPFDILTTPISITNSITGGTIPAGTYYVAVSVNRGTTRTTDAAHPDPARFVNESTPSVPVVVVTTGATSSLTVPRPNNAVSGDTWNTYIGNDRNRLKLVTANIPFANTTSPITTVPTLTGVDQSKLGKVDISWTAAVAGDAPTSYVVERADSNPDNSATGTPGAYKPLSAKVTAGKAGFYSTTKFWEDAVDTKYYFYRVIAVYSNDTSAPIDVTP